MENQGMALCKYGFFTRLSFRYRIEKGVRAMDEHGERREEIRTCKKRPLFRMAAAACMVVTVLAVALTAWSALYTPPIRFGPDTPVRVGKGTMMARLARSYTFSEAYQEADMVADVIITEWRGEMDEGGYTTMFYAQPMTIYKNTTGKEQERILLIQQGNSKGTFEGYSLYKNGMRLLLCLKEYDSSKPYYMEGPDNFLIVGAMMTEMYLYTDSEDTVYAVRSNKFCNNQDIEPYQSFLNSEVRQGLSDDMTIQGSAGGGYSTYRQEYFAYPLSDLENLMRQLDEHSTENKSHD